MTILTIESDSDSKTKQVLDLVEKLGLSVKKDEHRVLTDDDVAFGFGRPATEAELAEYFLSEDNDEPIDISVAFSKYTD